MSKRGKGPTPFRRRLPRSSGSFCDIALTLEKRLGSDQESLNKAIRETVSGLSDDDLSEILKAPKPQYTAFARQVAEEEIARRKTKPATYVIVVTRPYWLSFYASGNKRVAWVVTAGYELSCG